jgi:hypothetical protein
MQKINRLQSFKISNNLIMEVFIMSILQKKKTLSIRKALYLFGISLFIPFFSAGAQGTTVISTATPCNTPLVGSGRVVDNLSGNLLSLLNGNAGQIDNLLDGDLTNYATFGSTTAILSTPIVAVKDTRHTFAAGLKTGFVIEGAALINASLLSGFQIRTYMNDQLVETSGTGGANSLASVSLSLSSDQVRLSFVTQQPFNKVELVSTGLLSLGAVNVYYAFVEPPTCDYECMEPAVTGSANFPNPAVTSSSTFLLSSVANANNVISSSLTDYATATTAIGGTATITVKANKTIPAGSRIGFVVESSLLSLLDGITLISSTNGTMVETKTSGSLVGLDLDGNTEAVSFVTTQPCNEINIMFNGLAGSYNVYYAFAAMDSDLDGFADCADKCAGSSDNYDGDGDGIPDGCDNCMLNPADDLFLCPSTTSYDFGALNIGTGLTWSLLPGAPAGATVNPSTGLLTGMGQLGTYSVVARGGTDCADTINIFQQYGMASSVCNTPITGSSVTIFDPTGGQCLLCTLLGGTSNVLSVIDNDLSNYVETGILSSALVGIPVIGVQDNGETYPAGTKTGFVVSSVDGLISADLLSGFQINTYLNGTLQEIASVDGGNTVLSAGASIITGENGNQRISFVTTLPFNGIALISTGLVDLSALNNLRIYYAFQEPAEGCNESSDCAQLLSGGSIGYLHTEILGACPVCGILGLDNLLNDDPNSTATIEFTAGVANTATVSVRPKNIIGAGNQAGFILSTSSGLLDYSELSATTITTYLNGIIQEVYVGDVSVVSASILSDNRTSLTFLTTRPFDEISVSFVNLKAIAQTISVYNAVVYPDSDGDGVFDCMDKCCLGDDNIVGNDRVPVACANAEVPLVDQIARLRAAGAITGIGNQTISTGAIQVIVNDGYVTVSSSEEITGLKLYDVSGKLQYNSSGSGNYIERFAVPAQAGVSIITIETAEKVETQKVVF